MKKTNQIRLCITVLMLAAAVFVFFGKSVLNTGLGIVIEYKYIDAFLQNEAGSAFRSETVLWVRVLAVTGIAAALLVWIQKRWAVVITLILCLSSVIIRIYGNIKNGYGIFPADDPAAMAMTALPFIAAGMCLYLLLKFDESDSPVSADA